MTNHAKWLSGSQSRMSGGIKKRLITVTRDEVLADSAIVLNPSDTSCFARQPRVHARVALLARTGASHGCGDRVDKGRVPGPSRLKTTLASYGLWSRLVDRVMRRPIVSAAASVALLLALAAPALQMTIRSSGPDGLPQDLPLAQKFNHLEAAFPSQTSSLSVVVKAQDVTAPAVTAAVQKLEQATHRQPALFPDPGALAQDVNADKTVNTLTMQIAGDGTDAQSDRALDALRDELVPATLGRVGGLEAYATGGTAIDRDFN